MELLEEEQVTRLVMVPSLLRSLLFCLSVSGGDRRLPKLRLWLSNSETLQPSLLAKFFAVFADGRRFANLYGSSETMADVTYEMFSSADDAEAKSVDGKLSIGVPMCNSNMYVLGEDLELLPRGEVCPQHCSTVSLVCQWHTTLLCCSHVIPYYYKFFPCL